MEFARPPLNVTIVSASQTGSCPGLQPTFLLVQITVSLDERRRTALGETLGIRATSEAVKFRRRPRALTTLDESRDGAR